MPTGEIPTYGFDALLDDEDRAKRFFKGAGCTELINYSLVPATHLEKCGFKLDAAIRIANPLSADFEYMRMSLLPGFLQTIQENEGLFPEGRVFEVSNCYLKREGDLPEEVLALAGAVYGPYDDDRLFREAKGLFEAYAVEVGVRVAYERMTGGPQHPGRSVKILANGEFVGWIAETHPSVCKKFGVDCRVAAFEVPLAKFLTYRSTHAKYVPIPQFPPAKRDLALLVDETVEFGGMYESLLNGSALLKDVELFDVYRGKGVEPGKKSVAMHLTFADVERTLTAEEVDAAIAALAGTLKDTFGATVRT
jgi:phenylalanyl-tRNA synthetase beta chain